MNILIRKATLYDENLISKLEIELFSHTYFKDYRETFLSNQSVLIALDNQELIGIVGWFQQEDTAEIIMVGVKKEYRRMTVGSTLLKACISVLVSNSINKLFIEVRSSNHAALGLYKAIGFVVNRTRPNYYKDPSEDALEMRLDL